MFEKDAVIPNVWRRIILVCCLFFGGRAAVAAKYHIDTLFEVASILDAASVWELKAADLPQNWGGGDFCWSDNENREFHYSCRESDADLCFLGMPVAEADFLLTEPAGKLEMISLLLAAPGIEFNENADPELVRAHICRKLGTEWMFPVVLWQTGTLKMSATEWVSSSEAITLFEVTDNASGGLLYLGLLISPYVSEAPGELLKVVDVPEPPAAGKKKILLNVPSARQGDMDYCVPAAASRIARYYGSVMDCHLMAALTGCRDEMGVELNRVDSVLNSVSAVTGLECTMLYRNTDYSSYKAISLFFERYNRMAKTMKKKRFPLHKIMKQDEETVVRLLTEGLSGLDHSVLREMRQAERGNMERFQELVRMNILAGKPLLWCVLADKQDDRIAFHLRIIHGLRRDTGDFLWSDSLEGSVNIRETAADTAWDVTAFLAVLEPASFSGTPLADDRNAF